MGHKSAFCMASARADGVHSCHSIKHSDNLSISSNQLIQMLTCSKRNFLLYVTYLKHQRMRGFSPALKILEMTVYAMTNASSRIGTPYRCQRKG